MSGFELGLVVAITGAALVVGAWLHYFWLVPRGRLSGQPIADSVAMVLGMICALAGALLGPIMGGQWSIVALALLPVSIGLGLFFLWLLSIAPVPAAERAQLVVSVGDPLPAFSAWDRRGERFTWSSAAGDRVLLKFFRGHW